MSEKTIEVVIAGAEASGKSAFFIRACDNRFLSDYDPTIGLDFFYKKQGSTTLNFWELSGQEEFESISTFSFREKHLDAHLIALFVDLTNIEKSIDAFKKYQKYLSRKEVPCVLVFTKSDLAAPPSEEKIAAYKAEIAANLGFSKEQIKSHHITSARNNEGIESALESFTRFALNEINNETPVVYVDGPAPSVLSLSRRLSTVWTEMFVNRDNNHEISITHSVLSFLGCTGLTGYEKILYPIQMPFVILQNVMRLMTEYLLAVVESAFGFLLDHSRKQWDEYSWREHPLRKLAVGLGLLLGGVGYYAFKTLRLIARLITAPVESARQGRSIHLALGIFSIVLSISLYVVLTTFVAPIALIGLAKALSAPAIAQVTSVVLTQVAGWFTGAIPILAAAISAALIGLKLGFDAICATIAQRQNRVAPVSSRSSFFPSSENDNSYLENTLPEYTGNF